MNPFPETQLAIQLVGPGDLQLNSKKEVFKPGPYQILVKTEAVGLCFSDLKLLKLFTGHPRKNEIMKGMDNNILSEIASYVPGDKPTVPGHEVACRIVAIGSEVKQHKVGERVLVQTDYRDLPTNGSFAAFGYNFEGGLQEYVLMDERIVIDRAGERFLIPVPEHLSASAIAMIEPYACVEDSYVTDEKSTIKAGGRMLIVSDTPVNVEALNLPWSKKGRPASILIKKSSEVADLPHEGFDDIIAFAPDKATLEILDDKMATGCTINLVMQGKKIGAPVSIGVGRLHYGATRWVGTPGHDAAVGYKMIPVTGELRDNDTVLVIGAGGPMGQMHVIRAVASDKKNITVVATDMDDSRLESLRAKASPLAAISNAGLRMVNTARNPLSEKFSYTALMAPIPALVAQAVKDSTQNAIINIFAGIVATVKHEIDLDMVLEKQVFLFGTSGSNLRDMKIVLDKVQRGMFDTNTSLDAVSGMAGAIAGLEAVENRTLAGKIVVYPQLHNLPLTKLMDLPQKFPTVAAKMKNGQWTKEAEEELLKVAN